MASALLDENPRSFSGAASDFLRSLRVKQRADRTIRNYEQTLRRFLEVNGNLLLKNIREDHVEKYFEHAARTRGPASLNIDRVALNTFFEWARKGRRMKPDHDPMWNIDAFKVFRKERRRVHVDDFPRLLDAAGHPRDRMVIALGLYLFLRQSEMISLKVEDVDLDAGTIFVTVHKTKKQELMPISRELDEELRRWLTYYTNDVGPLKPEYPLLPRLRRPVGVYDPKTGRIVKSVLPKPEIDPTKPLKSHVETIAQKALKKIGFPIDEVTKTGRARGEGIHTLRRSGARAYFDELQAMEPVRDPQTGRVIPVVAYPIRRVQAMLNHDSIQSTEEYLGLEIDRWERDLLVRGRYMYPSLQKKRQQVVELKAYGGSH